MTDLTAFYHTAFLSLIVFYLFTQSALTFFEIRRNEVCANHVPGYFRKMISLPEHKKAVDYAGDLLQSDLLNAWLGAALALLLTTGEGINVLLLMSSTLFGETFGAQFSIAALVLFFVVLIDTPFAWWRNFRINERYGYERTDARLWRKNFLAQTLLGLIIGTVLLAALLLILQTASYYWWIVFYLITCSWYLWHFVIAHHWTMAFSASVTDMPASPLKKDIAAFLHSQGLSHVRIMTAPTPAGTQENFVTLSKRFHQQRLVICDAALKLTTDEILAMVAGAVGHVRHHHSLIRCALFFIFAAAFWKVLSIVTEMPLFYEAMGIQADLAIPHGAPQPGVTVIILSTIAPIVLYPLQFVIHLISRFFVYDSDAYAVRNAGAEPLISALVKLYDGRRNTLTPNRIYSVSQHNHPHIMHRIEAALRVSHRNQTLFKAGRAALAQTQARQFNAIKAASRVATEEKDQLLAIHRQSALAENTALRQREICLTQTN